MSTVSCSAEPVTAGRHTAGSRPVVKQMVKLVAVVSESDASTNSKFSLTISCSLGAASVRTGEVRVMSAHTMPLSLPATSTDWKQSWLKPSASARLSISTDVWVFEASTRVTKAPSLMLTATDELGSLMTVAETVSRWVVPGSVTTGSAGAMESLVMT